MKRSCAAKWAFGILIAIFSLTCVNGVLADEKTFVGQVNDNYQLVTSSQVYEIDDTAAGNDLAENHINAKVKVTGTLDERDSMKIITVVKFQVLSE